MTTATTATPNGVTRDDQSLLQDLRRHRRAHRHRAPHPPAPPPLAMGARVADLVAAVVGSWRFILLQSALLLAWIAWNAWGGRPWDPFPFILLNLLLSFQAAYTAPIIMMSQNRQAEIDRERAESDYQINIKAELEIELLHQKLDLLKEQEILNLTRAVEALAKKLEAQPRA